MMDTHPKIEMPIPIPDYYVAPQNPFFNQQVHAPIVISVMLSFIAIFSSLFLAIQQDTPTAAYAIYEQQQNVIVTPSPIVVHVESNIEYYADPYQDEAHEDPPLPPEELRNLDYSPEAE